MHTQPFTRLAALLTGLFLVAGCQQPAEIELESDPADENLEVYAVNLTDPDVATNPVDSIAVLPDDQTKYAGLFVINSVTWDAGTTVRHLAYSRALVGDTIVRVLGRKVGVRGRDLGTMTLNGMPMYKVPHRIPVNRIFGRDTSIIFGVEYVTGLGQNYLANHVYTWTMTPVSGTPRTVDIETPDSLVVLAPKGGAVFLRGTDADIRWSGGRGKMTIIVSAYEPTLNQLIPVMELRVKANSGRAKFPAKLLAMLPAHRHFVLTFVLANRSVSDVGQPVSATVLVQAAFVHNCYIEVQ